MLPVPQRRAAHRAPEGLLGRRRRRALPPPPRAAGSCIRWATTRSACRPRTTRSPPASTRATRRTRRSRSFREQFREWGISIDWSREFGTHEPALLPLDAVDLPAALRARAGLPQGGRRQVVPQRPDRAGQRAGHRRALRALRRRGRGRAARAVVLPHHRLRRPPARRPRHDRLARARQDDAAQLDRALGGRRGRVPLRGAGHRLPGLHHAPGHAVRRDVLRHGARAPRRRAARARDRAARTRSALRQPRAERVQRGARRRPTSEKTGVFLGPLRRQPGQRRAPADVRRRLRAHGVRHRRDHGRARPRRARPRVRDASSTCRSGA